MFVAGVAGCADPEFAADDGVVEADPEAFGEAKGGNREDQDAHNGDGDGGFEAEQAENEKQSERHDPDHAGEGVGEWDRAVAPAVFHLERKVAFWAALAEAESAAVDVWGLAAGAAAAHAAQ